jgi:hypothetical protein
MQIDHILVDRQRHSSVHDVQTFRAADCNTDRYLVVDEIRERLAVNKQRSNRFLMLRFSLKKLNEVEGRGIIALGCQVGLQLWKILMLSWISIVHGKQLKRKYENISKRESMLL